uniref:MAGUK p55 subfamily member 6-like n=1 Tax=Styela clava TaxID=7725 RepID=UPI001939ED9B|nr:MAGUK p55 subfamily member 6-like [Styela clava]
MTDKIENGHDQTTDVRHVLSGIDELKEVNIMSKESKVKEIEALANNPVVQSLAKAHKAMAEKKISPIRTDSLDLSQRIMEYVNELPEDELYEQLKILLTKPHFTSLLKCQDDVGIKNKTNIEQLHGTNTDTNGNHKFDGLEKKTNIPRAIRMVGLYKKSWEPLGLTVAKEGNELKIARILHGSEIEKKGLLHVDDIIMEVNGNSLGGDPKKLQEYLLKTSGLVVFKILPSYEENLPPKLLYIKCHINYDPKEDDQSPCVEAGLSFKKGDILQVVDQKDSDWWQAQRVNNKGEARGRAGLIPSLSFEEKKKSTEGN